MHWTENHTLNRWIEKTAAQCLPESIHLCDGSDKEFHVLAEQMVRSGALVPLNPTLRPASFWCRSDPGDVARVEECTFICSQKKQDAGPTNNWEDPTVMRKKLGALFKGCMQGRTLYIVPYLMGPIDSPFSRVGVQLTDSIYAVLNMKIMTRMGTQALRVLKTSPFVSGLHSVGAPLKAGEADVLWPCNLKNRVIAHFPEEQSIFSFGSGYGGNALLGKKCFALRIASSLARNEGWLAEHMLILGITNPKGQKKYIAAAFPSACGKTNLAMMTPTLPGWKIETVGDDIAWIHLGSDGRLYAINPEAGYFGVAPGTSPKTNPNAMQTIGHHALFTNTALTLDKDVWWEGMGQKPPEGLTSWLGDRYDPASGMPAAHPNSRFTVSAKQNPIYDAQAENPQGVPLDAILFGGRRSSVMPLVVEAFDWKSGVFFGASISSETTAASQGDVGKLRHDPFAMLPFCGYNMGDYFAHWFSFGKKSDRLPRIYAVNWFQKSADGKYLWPGFGENGRVLEWIFNRTSNDVPAQETPIGLLPYSLNLSGLNLGQETVRGLFAIDKALWLAECNRLRTYFQLFGASLPSEISDVLSSLEKRLGSVPYAP